MRKEIQIKVGAFVPVPAHELVLEAVCAFYKVSRDELFSASKDRECSRRRAMLYYLTKEECFKSNTEIGRLYGVKRQLVSKLVDGLQFETKNYLQISCEYDAIKAFYLNLLKQQQEWLSQLSNTKHSIRQ